MTLREIALIAALGSLCACQARPDVAKAVSALSSTECTPVCEDNFTVTSGGEERDLVLQVPQGYDGKIALPLILILHGFGGDSGSHCSTGNGFYCPAEAQGYAVAYLNGTLCDPSFGDEGCPADHPGRGWNSGLTPSLGITVDDVQFVRDVIAQVGATVRIDPRRVYVVGFSNGAIMAHRLAAELSDVLAAVALSAGTIGRSLGDGLPFVTIPDAVGSIPILMMHGTEDTAMGVDGNSGYLCPCKSLDDALAYWLEQNPCRGPSSSVTDGTVTTTTFAGCFANNDVVLKTIDGWPHKWPEIGTDAALSFFAKHSLTADAH